MTTEEKRLARGQTKGKLKMNRFIKAGITKSAGFHTGYFINLRLFSSISSPGNDVGSSQQNARIKNIVSDPMARRPTKVCDPYGQDGKPMERSKAIVLLTTLNDGWELDTDSKTLTKQFYHSDYMSASKFLTTVAAVAHNNNHFPSISLERHLGRDGKRMGWRVITTVTCTTPTLAGLSTNDFHVAMLVDVETEREHVNKLLLGEKESLRKNT